MLRDTKRIVDKLRQYSHTRLELVPGLKAAKEAGKLPHCKASLSNTPISDGVARSTTGPKREIVLLTMAGHGSENYQISK